MSNAPLPASVDAFRLFEQGAERKGQLSLASMERLMTMLSGPEGHASAELGFAFDDRKHRIVTGTVRAQVQMQCQRCLGIMTVSLESEFRAAVVSSDDLARSLPSELEPVVVPEGQIDLLTLVEDELILALPEFPMHGEHQCPAAPVISALNAEANAAIEAENADAEETNPFRVLAGLKGHLDDGER